ncbi:Hypothetical protein HDN1F_22190 [gamma proteobacterium HdN1]|nr:Hypothetical protein HDN1F_22190 [gamma proteobacterium HdN1]
MKKHHLALAIGLTSALTLTACGGGGSSSKGDNSGQQPPPAQQQKVVRGTIDGFGSVIVNGVRYNTDGADFKVKEKSGTQADLRVGQVVTLLADGTTATHVIYDLSLEGPISAFNGQNGFQVLGQNVITNSLTIFEDTALAALGVGSQVEVSGYVDASGNLVASFVGLDSDDNDEVELRGTISHLDESAKTFQLRGQKINFSNVSEWDLEGATLRDGLRVEVEGSLSGLVLNATSIEAEDEDFDEGTKLTISGLISGLDINTKTLLVNGVKVQFSANTKLDDFNLSALVDGLSIEVEGRVDAQGVLIAEEMDLADTSEISVEASISNIEKTDEFSGKIIVLGLEISVDMRTRMRDDGNRHNTMFNFGSLRTGDKIELTLIKEGQNYRALKLERDNDDSSEVKLELPASLINFANGTALGVSFSVAAGVHFPSVIPADVQVEMKGHFNGGVLIVREIEIDDQD